jgi:hypothetical protein
VGSHCCLPANVQAYIIRLLCQNTFGMHVSSGSTRLVAWDDFMVLVIVCGVDLVAQTTYILLLGWFPPGSCMHEGLQQHDALTLQFVGFN